MSLDFIDHLALGFQAAATWQNLGFAFFGCLLGTVIGVLPGIGTIPAIALLLPATYGLEPLSSLIMLAGIYYGAQYGGSTTSILVNMPGESSSVVTCIDGHQMARNGRAGSALAIAALGSFFAGCVGTLFIAAFGPVLGAFSLQFNAPEFFALLVLGLTMGIILARGSAIKALAMVAFGLLLGVVGTDVNTGVMRYTFDSASLWDGLGFLPLVIGLFGVTEVIRNLEEPDQARVKMKTGIRDLYPSRQELREAWPAAVRGTAIGAILGVLPGGGAVLSSFASYTVEKKIARFPEKFGHGAVQGLAGPESANNAGAQTSFIPLLTLGLPSNALMALIMGAMMIHGIAPGTSVMSERPELFWGMIASMWIGNAMLVVLNLPLIGLWVKLLSVPYRLLFPSILMFCAIGVYGTDDNLLQMSLTCLFALFGYIMLKVGCEPAPLVLGFVLGPPMESNLRRSLTISDGSALIFFERPIAATLLVAAIVVIALIVFPQFRQKRQEAFAEEG